MSTPGSTTTQRFVIQVTQNGAQAVVVNINQIADSAAKAEGGVDSLKRALQLLTAGLGIRELVQLLDTYTLMQNRLKLVTSSTDELREINERLFESANRTRSSYESTVELYARVARSAGDLGVSQNTLLKVTEAVNQAIQISGATSQEAAAGVLQLGQALASGRLQGDELRSILENMPRLARAIADGMGKQFGQLRKLGQEGQLTSKSIIDAIINQSGVLQAEFAKTTPTIGNSLTVLHNNFLKFIGDLDKSTGIVALLSKLILTLANNLDTVLKVILGLAAGPAIILGIAAAFNQVVSAVRALTVAMLANPLTSWLVVLTSVIALLYNFRDAIMVNRELGLTLGDYFSAAFDQISEGVQTAYKWVTETLIPVIQAVIEEIPGIGTSFLGTIAEFKAAGNEIINAVVQTSKLVITVWQGVVPAIKDIFTEMFQGGIDQIQKFADAIQGGINKGRSFFGMEAMPQFKFGKIDNPNAGAAAAFGKNISDIMGKSLDTDYIGEEWSKLTLNAWKKSLARNAPQAAVDLNKHGVAIPTPDPNAEKALKKFQAEYKRLLDQISPIYKAQQELANAEKVLNEAVSRGVVTREKANEMLAILKARLKDVLDPMGMINRQIQEQTGLLKLNTDQREVEQQILDYRKQLLQAGIILNDKQTQQLREQLTALQELNKQRAVEEDLYKQIKGPQEDYTRQVAALATLLAQGRITTEQYNKALEQTRLTYLETQNTAGAGLERALIKLKQSYEDAGTAMEQAVNNVATSLEDTLTTLFSTGKFNFSDFANSLVADINRMIVRTQILLPLLRALGVGGGDGGAYAPGLGGAASGGGLGSTLMGLAGNALSSLLPGAAGGLSDLLGQAVGGVYGSGVQAGLDNLISGLPGFASGGSFRVGGAGGVDSQLVAFRASPWEDVTVSHGGQSRPGADDQPQVRRYNNGMRPVQMIVQTPDANSFLRSQQQVGAAASKLLARANKRNN